MNFTEFGNALREHGMRELPVSEWKRGTKAFAVVEIEIRNGAPDSDGDYSITNPLESYVSPSRLSSGKGFLFVGEFPTELAENEAVTLNGDEVKIKAIQGRQVCIAIRNNPQAQWRANRDYRLDIVDISELTRVQGPKILVPDLQPARQLPEYTKPVDSSHLEI